MGVLRQRQEAESLMLPVIPGYDVWAGRVLLHARAREGFARGSRPFHVTAATPHGLLSAVRDPGVSVVESVVARLKQEMGERGEC